MFSRRFFFVALKRLSKNNKEDKASLFKIMRLGLKTHRNPFCFGQNPPIALARTSLKLRGCNLLIQGGPGSVTVGVWNGYGWCVERLERSQFSVPTVPLENSSGLGSRKTIPTVPVPVSVLENPCPSLVFSPLIFWLSRPNHLNPWKGKRSKMQLAAEKNKGISQEQRKEAQGEKLF